MSWMRNFSAVASFVMSPSKFLSISASSGLGSSFRRFRSFSAPMSSCSPSLRRAMISSLGLQKTIASYIHIYLYIIPNINKNNTHIYIYIYIYSNILSWNIIEKKTSGHVGTRTCVAGLSQQTCYAKLYFYFKDRLLWRSSLYIKWN